MERIALPYNTRVSTLWTPFDGGNLGCQKWTIQDNAYTTSNKLFGIQKLTPQVECRWTVIKMITVGKAQRTKWLPKSIFYRWYDQWTLSKLARVQLSSKWGHFNTVRADPRFVGVLKTPHSRWRLSMTLCRFWQIILRYFAFLRLTLTNLVTVEIESRRKNTPLLVIWHRVAGVLLLRDTYFRIERSS